MESAKKILSNEYVLTKPQKSPTFVIIINVWMMIKKFSELLSLAEHSHNDETVNHSIVKLERFY